MKREQIIKRLNEFFISPENIRIYEVDYSNNHFAPEKKAYKIFFTELGKRVKVVFWPNTVGFQGVRE